MMTRRIKLGILQVNHDKSPEVGDIFPDDAHRFRDLFDAQEQRFQYQVYMTIGGEVPMDVGEQDAYLITGSPLSVLDDHAFLPALYDFIRRCDEARVPLLGVCFGHQAIAAALGGTVARADWNIGIEPLHFTGDAPGGLHGACNMYQFHHDAVTVIPDGMTRIAHSPMCSNAALAKGRHILTIQSHPEFTDPFMRCVLNFTRPHLDAQCYARAQATLVHSSQGPEFACKATKFFKGQR